MRIVSGAVAHSHINNLYEELYWLNLRHRRIKHTLYTCMFYTYKITHGDIPSYLCDILPKSVGDKNDYNSLSAHKMYISFTRLKCYR